MQCLPALRVGAILLALVFPQLAVPTSAQDPGFKISTPEQIKEDFATVPCEDKERLAAVRALFERAGVPPGEIAIDRYKSVDNLFVTIKGASSEKIVVGAHYDKVSEGCGALDNWTGIVTLSHLYKTFKNITLKKTLVLIAFGKEEKGLIGSRAMTSALTKEQAAEYCAMINIDSLGLAPPQVADNMSSKKLGQFTEDLAKEMKIPFSRASIDGADSDSSAFVEKKIPAVTIHGMNSDWAKILHSRFDQTSKVNEMSVYLGYRLTLAMVFRLDQSSCAAYR
ncbi:MAG: M20/M25/M40 family metallo-hydrolase [Pyrinomonadaceae bacterium]|nr:M20/M25/M40 family metallo-hydrolase [Pyrinomonadaceae bacterium]